MSDWCASRAHCPTCVKEPEWRLKAIGRTDCPHGVTADSLPPEGPGTQLKLLFEHFGITPKPGCRCASLMARMNAWGAKGCEEHLEEIVSDLLINAEKLEWAAFVPFKGPGFRAFVKLAIARAGANY